MDAILNSPFFSLIPLMIGLIVGWLVRESMLLRAYNLKLAHIAEERDIARSESEALQEQISLTEADAKKAIFDNHGLSDRLEIAETDRHDLQKTIRENKAATAILKKEVSSLKETLAGQDDQMVGLRARIAQLSDAATELIEKEDAEKRLHEDFAAAVLKIGALEKQLDQLTAAHTKLNHEKESIYTQLLDYQLINAKMPGLLAANNASGLPKKRAKKGAEQPLAIPEGGQENGESGSINLTSTAPKDDLKVINTITAAQEAELFKIGITTIEQLANLSEHQLLEIAEGSSRLAKRMQKENWVDQAKYVLAAA